MTKLPMAVVKMSAPFYVFAVCASLHVCTCVCVCIYVCVYVQQDDGDVFNEFLRQVKEDLQGTRYSAFWEDRVTEGGVTLISSSELAGSTVSPEQAAQVHHLCQPGREGGRESFRYVVQTCLQSLHCRPEEGTVKSDLSAMLVSLFACLLLLLFIMMK